MTERELLRLLQEEARLLQSWADEAERGGWSTQHVRPMRERASKLFAIVGQSEAIGGPL